MWLRSLSRRLLSLLVVPPGRLRFQRLLHASVGPREPSSRQCQRRLWLLATSNFPWRFWKPLHIAIYLLNGCRCISTGLIPVCDDFVMRVLLRCNHGVFGVPNTNRQIGELLGEWSLSHGGVHIGGNHPSPNNLITSAKDASSQAKKRTNPADARRAHTSCGSSHGKRAVLVAIFGGAVDRLSWRHCPSLLGH